MILGIARETGFVQRHRKLDPVAFLYTLASETEPQLQRTVEALRDAYNKRPPTPSSAREGSTNGSRPNWSSSFVGAWPTPLPSSAPLPGTASLRSWRGSSTFQIHGSTVIRLFAALAKFYPPARLAKNTRSNRTAGVQVATLFSARANRPTRLELCPETASEIDTLKTGPWVNGSVVLTDLGFYNHQGFTRIEENGGFFLSRLKGNANPVLIRSHLVHRGRAIGLAVKRGSEVAPRFDREALEAEVELSVQRRGYRGRHRGDTLRARLVAVWVEEHRQCHTYITNLPVDARSAEEVTELYRTRGSGELLFKEAKGSFHLDRVATGNRNVAESLIWASWLALLVSRRVTTPSSSTRHRRSGFGIRRFDGRKCSVTRVPGSLRRC